MKKKLSLISILIMAVFFSFSIQAEDFRMEMEIRIPEPPEEPEEPRVNPNEDLFYNAQDQSSRQFSWLLQFYPDAKLSFSYNTIPQKIDAPSFSKEGTQALQTFNRPGVYHFMSLDPKGQSSEINVNITQRSSSKWTYALPTTIHYKEARDSISIYGWSAPKQSILLTLDGPWGEKEYFVLSSDLGYYELYMEKSIFLPGKYQISSRYEMLGNTGEEKFVFISIDEEQNLVAEESSPSETSPSTCFFSIADFNKDCRVDYIDLDYLRQRFMLSDLNHDGLIDLVDYSIFSYFWTS